MNACKIFLLYMLGAALMLIYPVTWGVAADTPPGMRTDPGTTQPEKPSAPQAQPKTPVKDSWVTAKTKIALFEDSRVKGRQIHVKTQKGVVTLRGKVDSDTAKSAAEEIAKRLVGVKSVNNELQVVPRVKTPGQDVVVKDEVITDEVRGNLLSDSNLKKARIDVQTSEGVVTLKGEVPDLSSSAEASYIAWRVKGVKSVKNELEIPISLSRD